MKLAALFFSILLVLGSNFVHAQEPGPPPSPEPIPEPGPITVPGPKQIPNPFPGESSDEKIKRLQEENDKLRSENNRLESQKTSLEKEVADLKKRVSNLQAIIQEQIKVILDIVSKLKQDVDWVFLNPSRPLLS
jgi:hypothetical protein